MLCLYLRSVEITALKRLVRDYRLEEWPQYFTPRQRVRNHIAQTSGFMTEFEILLGRFRKLLSRPTHSVPARPSTYSDDPAPSPMLEVGIGLELSVGRHPPSHRVISCEELWQRSPSATHMILFSLPMYRNGFGTFSGGLNFLSRFARRR